MSNKITTETFVERAKKIHGDKYDYSLVDYVSAKNKVNIICKIHGLFSQTPSDHQQGSGCNLCGLELSAKKQVSTKSEFITKAKLVHSDFYDYSLVNYVNAKKKVVIVCPEHGQYLQDPSNHLAGKGCQECKKQKISQAKKYNVQSFINKSIDVHGDKYDYSLVNYKGSQKKVTLICKKHGKFSQSPDGHLQGLGCSKCGRDSASEKITFTNEFFIEKAKITHNDSYNYSKTDYINSQTKVTITYPKHGDFEQTPASHLYGCGCPNCGYASFGQSKPELEIIELIESLGLQVVHGDRSIIKPLEIDILVPEAKLAIEFNGNYWHSDKQKPKSYHFDKTKAANEAGYRMIHVWEGDWDDRKDQIKRIIINACGKTNEKPLNARDCKVEEIEMKVINEFLDEHHIQGRVHQAKIKLGLVHKTEGLVAVMTFGKGTNIRGTARVNAEVASEVPWNLTRYAAKHSVRGGASKLFKAAVTRYELTFVESYSMNDYFTGGMYEQLGFGRTVAYGADYRVFHPKTGIRFKYHWQRRNIPNVLRDIGREDIVFNPDKSIDPRTEFEIEDLAGALRLWDSGKTKWTWRATL